MDMQLAHYWAHVFGPILVLMGLWMFLYSENVAKILASFKTSPACFHLLGMIQLVFGLMIVVRCNAWYWDWSLAIVLLGWFFVVRGVLSLFFPQVLMKMFSKAKMSRAMGIIPLIWGLILYWFSFS
jgi:uncharacterized protein YjeT (DUF2065 family)